MEATRIGGHISPIGMLTGVAGPVPTQALLARQQRLRGLIVVSRRHQQDMVRGLNARQMRPAIDRPFGLEAIGDAFRLQEVGGQFGKIVLEF